MLSKDDLISYQEALIKDYGIKLEGQELYAAAFSLLQFIELLIKFDQEDVNIGSKIVHPNPLNSDKETHKI